MRRQQERRRGDAGAPVWSSARLLATVAAGAVAVLALLVGLVFAVVTGLGDGASRRAGAAPGPIPASTAMSDEDALAAAPMPSADPAAAQPGPLSTREAGSLELPRAGGTGPAEVPTGFPRTPEGALAQLAAIDMAAMQTGSVDDARRVISSWAAPGGPTSESWSGVKGMAELLSSAGLPGGGSPQLAIVVRPLMGLVKGTVGPGFAVVCADFEFTVTVAQTSRIAVADCQRMAWAGERWLIGPGAEPAPAPSVWPGTDAAIAAGYRELRYV